MRRGALVAVTAAAALAAPASAWAHAALLHTTPAASVVLNRPPKQVANDPLGFEVLARYLERGAAVPPVVALHLLHRRSRLVGRGEREEALAGREELAEAGVLRDHRAPGGQIARASIAEPTASRGDITAFGDADFGP